MKADRAVLVGLVLFYAILGLAVFDSNGMYTGDIGVKYVQARALAASGYTSLDIPYPAAFIDRSKEFAPLRPPFVLITEDETQGIFSPAFAVVQAVAVSVADLPGLTIVSILAGALLLVSVRSLAPPAHRAEVLVVVGLAGPLWFYVTSGWEHAPAIALGTAAFAVALTSASWAGGLVSAALLGGLLLGVGAVIRDEVLLLAPGLMLASFMRTRRAADPAFVALGVGLALAASAGLDTWVFGRPPAAHLRHAVHSIQAAATATSIFDPAVPVLAPFTLRDRYETVIHYWLLGYGMDLVIVTYVIGLAVALLVRWRLRSSSGLLIWIAAVIALCAIDVVELLTAPKWLAGLHRVSPFLVFALFPRVQHTIGRVLSPGVVLFTTAVYLAAAFATVDTAGGKGLGPRLLLPLLPLLAVVATARIREYVDSPAALDRWVGAGGAALVGMTIVMHLFGALPAYYQRNLEDGSTVAAVASATERIIVTDDQFTAQLLLPLYHRKLIMVADTAKAGERVGELLAQHRIRQVVLVTRGGAAIDLPPFSRRRTRKVGRMTLQYWQR